MDKATLIGLVVGFALIVGSIMMGGQLGAFVNIPGIVIVLGGTICSSLIAENMGVVAGSVRTAMKAFFRRTAAIDVTIKQIADLAVVVRKDGLLALENQQLDDPFLAKGIRLAVDGLPAEEVKAALYGEMVSLRDRHKAGQRLFRFMGATAPAMGMVGTLIGLVQMLQVLSDPSAIGPAMAVALLTTLYGAVLAFLVFTPIANKLETRTKDEEKHMSVVLQGLESILKGENARIVQEKLEAFLAPGERQSEDDGYARAA